MAAMSASPERIEVSRPLIMGTSPSKLTSSDVAPEFSSSSDSISYSADTPDRGDLSSSSPNPNRDSDNQSLTSLKSEEYRQLFRLPPEEVLVQDFNCAFQESILFQGHMYLFVHHICFYSNIFGFETKKIIPFEEITSVKRAKTAGIFPNAIEIFAGGKKYFFASFLSRDEAFKIINDGWLQHGNGSLAISEQQESSSESISQENGFAIEKLNSSKHTINEMSSTDRDKDPSTSNGTKLPDSIANDASTSLPKVEDNIEQDRIPVVNTDTSSPANLTWKPEDSDAPQIPECYTMVAEAKFPIKVEEFFDFFFSNSAVSFMESFHKRCGDKEFQCSSWYPHEKFGHARDVSFQHPIKIYFGAKFGNCQEISKFRVYRNSHLVIRTSQEVDDVPYGDYFRVETIGKLTLECMEFQDAYDGIHSHKMGESEGLWDVEGDNDGSKKCCILRVYVNVAFMKRTVWKGKIVQSALEECREIYALWIEMAHEFLKQKNLKKREETSSTANLIENRETQIEGHTDALETSQRSQEDNTRRLQMFDSTTVNQQVGNLLQGSSITTSSISSFLIEHLREFCSLVKSQSQISLVLTIAFAVILLMQVSIVVLLNRPQHIHVVSPVDYMGGGGGERSSEAMDWMEKRIHYLKDEMLMVEARLQRIWHEHAVLKEQLKDLQQLGKQR